MALEMVRPHGQVGKNREIERETSSMIQSPQKSSATQVCGFSDSIMHTDADLFPNIRLVMQVSATRPSSTASAERSFSGLKRLKTYLRSSMLEDRLSALALLHIHQDIPVPVDDIIDSFARLGPHRLAYL